MDGRNNPEIPTSPDIPNQGRNPPNLSASLHPAPNIPKDNENDKPPNKRDLQYPAPGILDEDEKSPNKLVSQDPSPGILNEDEKLSNKYDPQDPSPGVLYEDEKPPNKRDSPDLPPNIPYESQNHNLSGPKYPSVDIPNPAQNTNSVPDSQNTSPGISNQEQIPFDVPESQYPSPGIPYEGQKLSSLPDPEHPSPDIPNQSQNTYNVPDLQNISPDIPNQGQISSNVPELQYPSPSIPYDSQKPSEMLDSQYPSSGVPYEGQNSYNVPNPQNALTDVSNQDQGPNNVPDPQSTSSVIPDQNVNPSNMPGLQYASLGNPNQGQNAQTVSNVPGSHNQSPSVTNQELNASKASGPNATQDQSTSTGSAPDTQSIKSGGPPGINEELHGKVTKYMLYAVISAILGMFQFGYNAGAVNQPREFIEAFILLQDPPNEKPSDAGLMFSIIVGIFAIGGMVGSPLSAYLCDKFGRKEILIANAAFGIVGSLLMALCKEANSVEMLIVGRLLNGINCGVSSAVCPTYVSEIAPVNLRGAFGAANQLAMAIGVTFGQVLGIDPILGSDDTWPILFGLVAVPALIQFVMLLFAPKSPRYLLFVLRDEERARNVLFKLRGTPDIDEEIRAMHIEDRLEKEGEKFGVFQLCKHRHFLRPLIVGIVLHLSHQWGGINVLLNFSSTIFEDASLNADQARYASIGVGLVLILNVFISIFLMDRFGRRKLELTGLGGMALFSALMTVGLNIQNFVVNVMTVVFAFLYIASFGIGPSSIPWMLMSEMFTQSARSTAVSIGAMVNWFANFVVGISFVTLRDGFATYVFLPFTILLIIFIIFVYFFLPETRHKTHEQMHHHFKDGIELPGGFIL